MKNSNILIIDDNKNVLKALEMLLLFRCKMVKTTHKPERINSLMQKNQFDCILLDMNFNSGVNNGNEGLYWLKKILEINPRQSVLMITAYGDVELAVKAIKRGAFDFIIKPWDNAKLMASIEASIKHNRTKEELKNLKFKEKKLKANVKQEKNIIGSSPQLVKILNIIDQVAKTGANILITGENGTGKELIAQRVYALSKRNKDIFVSVDMGSINENLFESEMFGHVRGAFTSARENRIGKFELAHGGTIFLDEIANLSLPSQAKLLSVLENRKIVRVGSNKEIPIDIRLICATNANLLELVQKGLFREDLLYRINTIKVEVPPLRERVSDISELAVFFLNKYTQKYGKNKMRLNAQAIKKMENYHWKGNIRELKHTLEKIVILNDNETIKPTDFFFYPIHESPESTPLSSLAEMEKNFIKRSLEHNSFVLNNTAQQLGISRQTLYNKIKKYNL